MPLTEMNTSALELIVTNPRLPYAVRRAALDDLKALYAKKGEAA